MYKDMLEASLCLKLKLHTQYIMGFTDFWFRFILFFYFLLQV